MPANNIICLVIDRLRSSALGAYGNTWFETPELDRLASESFLLDSALIDSTSLTRLYRGYWQSLHALRPDDSGRDAGHLPALLTQHQVDTTLLTDDPQVAKLPITQAFDTCIRLETHASGDVADEAAESQLARFFAALSERIEQHASPGSRHQRPFFLWGHARGMNGPWDAPLAFRQQLIDPEDPQPPAGAEVPNCELPEDFDPDELFGFTCAYGGQIALLDQCVGALIEHLRQTALLDKTLLVLIGARGFSLGEHQRVGSMGDALYGEVIEIPWLIRFPDAMGAAVRCQGLVQPPDLPATLLDWLGIGGETRSPDSLSLLPLARGEADEVRDHVGLRDRDGQIALRTPAWHLIRHAVVPAELFAKPDDRWDANDVADRCAEIVRGLTAALERFERSKQGGEAGPLPPLAEELRSSVG